MGVFGPKDGIKHQTNIKYNWIIQETPNGEKISESSVIEENVESPDKSEMIEGTYFKYLFNDEGILVKAGQNFNICMNIKFDNFSYSFATDEKERKRKVKDSDEFLIFKSSLDQNGLDVDKGLFPSLFYAFV